MDRIVDTLNAEAIDDGSAWRAWGQHICPEHRVDWRLLNNLKELDGWLQDQGGLNRDFSHALIGKYVYLHYLRDRDILSSAKLKRWGILQTQVFGRDATIDGVREVVDRLDSWLNGSVFPLKLRGPNAPSADHIRRVAATFAGDELQEDKTWQLHLDFKAYDFSYIPIETLSIVYEQFLHAPEAGGEVSRGRAAGAYYTPIPVVNFMLAELEEQRPLQRGMRIFDPSCGSGAFLVQSYRRLIEKEYPHGKGRRPTPADLRKLLKDHVFGVDKDDDACSVTELSLILTLLDNVEPPDLETGEPGRPPSLPTLRNQNIFCGDFFDEGDWHNLLLSRKASWIVGNPPWKQVSPKPDSQDQPAWKWISQNAKERPVGSNQLARAFAWRAADYLAQDGRIALFLPAMTLFEDPAREFRSQFFRQMKVHAVANFANLAEVLAVGRSRAPAAAFFYCSRPGNDDLSPAEETIMTYSPLVANQEATRPVAEGKRNEAWSLVINASEIRNLALEDVIEGDALPWKLATWGSGADARLLRALRKRNTSLSTLEDNGIFGIAEGLQLRAPSGQHRELERVPIAAGKTILNVKKLTGLGDFFAFPEEAIESIPPEMDHGRKGRVVLAMSVCRPPHVIVSAARNFAVYMDDFLIVPPRQIGIVSPTDDRDLLKALSLYLSSDFAFYHQFLTSSQFGVKRGVATLAALRNMPVPIEAIRRNMAAWVDLHGRLVGETKRVFQQRQKARNPLLEGNAGSAAVSPELLGKLNDLTYEALGLRATDRLLVQDLVRVRLELNDGKTGKIAVAPPTTADLRAYANALKDCLDAFLEGVSPKRHKVDIVHSAASGMVRIDLKPGEGAAREIEIVPAADATGVDMERIRKRIRTKRAQWVYFDRNLRIYEGKKTFVLKPMQRFHWLASQAMIDAQEIIAETLSGSSPTSVPRTPPPHVRALVEEPAVKEETR
ncbi:MAG: N-6 DNA methylase [Planctomycetota bacterium]|nr:N-6 DNA methylase [Planctomycetota bacterium]